MAIRCKLYDEEECFVNNCIDRVGTPCYWDALAQAGLDNSHEEEVARLRAAGVDDYFETHEQNDLQDWSDNEAWEDALADSQDWGE